MNTPRNETWLNAGQLLCLDSAMAPKDKQDVLLSTLYFQLAASAKVNKPEHITEWFDVYQACLQAFGWRTLRSRQSCDHFPGSLVLTWPDILQTLMPDGVPGPLEAITQVFQPGRGLAEPARSQFAGQSVSENGSALYQVAVLVGVGHLSAHLDMLLVHFQTRQPITGDLTQATFDSSELEGGVMASWLTACPDGLIFPEYRDHIHQSLEGLAAQHVLRIDQVDHHVPT